MALGLDQVPDGRIELRLMPVPRDEPPVRVVIAEWTDLSGPRRVAATGSMASMESVRAPSAAIGEAIERRAWLTTSDRREPEDGYLLQPFDDAEPVRADAGEVSAGTSNGWACGRTLADARTRAATEVVERHLYSLHHLCRQAASRCILPPGHRWRSLLDRYLLEIDANRLSPDPWPMAVVLVAIFDTTQAGPAATVGLGCAVNEDDALDHAILEALKVRMWSHQLHARMRLPGADEKLSAPEARLIRLAANDGAGRLRRHLSDRAGSDHLLSAERVLTPTGDTAEVAVRAAAADMGIELYSVDRGQDAALDLRPVMWVFGRGARFVNDEADQGEVALA